MYAYGLATLNFGSPTLTAFGSVVKDASFDVSPGINVMLENETGSIVARRYDDNITKSTFNGYINVGSGSLSLVPGMSYSVTSSQFTGKLICEKLSLKYTAKDFTQFTVEGVTSQYLNIP